MKIFFLIIVFLFTGSVEANEVEFLWKIAKSHRENSDLMMEEMSLNRLLSINPNYDPAIKRLEEIRVQKEKGDNQEIQKRLEFIQSVIRGEPMAVMQQKKKQVGFATPEAEAEFLERALRKKNLSDNQKLQMKEKLSRFYFKKAMKAIKEEKIRVAIESLEKSISYNGKFQLSYYELGFLYFRIRELQRGIQNLEKFVDLQPSGILAKTVRETLLHKYMSIARKYYYQQDFANCRPYLERIIRLNRSSPEASTALVYLMNLYYFQGMKHLQVEDFALASHNFYQALEVLKEDPDLDRKLFAKLAKNAIEPFIKHAQKLFIIDKDYGQSYTYFQAVTRLVPGSPRSFLAKEYMKEIHRRNETAKNPIVYFSKLVEDENQRFLLERRGLDPKAN